ncbi:MAG: DUF1415 domain-containing protein [Bacteroidota bacterium]
MTAIEHTQRWLSNFVIGLSLCPFAKLPFEQQKIRYVPEQSDFLEDMVASSIREWNYLMSHPEVETTLLIVTHGLKDFEAYLDALAILEEALQVAQLEGVFQIASFHPDYQFAGTQMDDVSNYTNRSPYPMFHFLREKSVQWAVASHPDTEAIPDQNIARLEALGMEKTKQRLHDLDRAD